MRSLEVSACLLLAGCGVADAAAPALPPSPWAVSAMGRVDAAEEARALVAERDAVIARVHVRPGQAVRMGDVLVELRCADAMAREAGAVAAARAAGAEAALVDAGPREEVRVELRARADEAVARAADARDLLARAEGLVGRGFVSTRRVSELRAEVAAREATVAAAGAALRAAEAGARPEERIAARARLAGAEAEAAAARAMAEKCVVKSPIDGTVTRLWKREGEFSGASAGTALLSVADLSRMMVRAEIADRDAAKVRLGQAATVWIDGDMRHWHGRVVELSAQMGRKTARSLDPSDRFDRDVREALVAFDGAAPPAVIGLRVNVGLARS
ncbi:HlyD family secretion protein [Sandaracinobacteroides saxicola]|uniref:Efflux RND transporter periplasmic adaptor subunit n=1 Tax=Sandaracinobacteroides saxicola TaxID=2759707 RepID=A0A7G5IJ70_9SPHN|nr:efflux RND transporter periplasmic adaptor subunit [Sandaracinobacteroides saxicola]QMW23412.1 efflux RND transporter periplasmic adaptor subunit [Sandaracinobacteroides saxicola]